MHTSFTGTPALNTPVRNEIIGVQFMFVPSGKIKSRSCRPGNYHTSFAACGKMRGLDTVDEMRGERLDLSYERSMQGAGDDVDVVGALALALCDKGAAEFCDQDEDIDSAEVDGDCDVRVVVHAIAPVLALALDFCGKEVFLLVTDVEASDGVEENGAADRENK